MRVTTACSGRGVVGGEVVGEVVGEVGAGCERATLNGDRALCFHSPERTISSNEDVGATTLCSPRLGPICLCSWSMRSMWRSTALASAKLSPVLLMIRSMHFRTTGLSVNAGLLEEGVSSARDEETCWGARILEDRLPTSEAGAQRPAWAGPAWTPQLGFGISYETETSSSRNSVNVAWKSPTFSSPYGEIIAR